MDDIQLSQANGAYIQKLQTGAQNPIDENQPVPIEEKKDNSDKLKLALVGLGIVAAAGIGIFAATRGKKIKLENIEFDKGFAKLKGETSGFTGKIQDTLKNGDKIILEYKDGVIQNSTRKGKINLTKAFKEVDGERIVSAAIGDRSVETNITKIQAEVKASQSELDKILKDKDNLSLDEFKKQADAIKFKNKAQQAEINDIISAKKEEIKQIEAFKRVNKRRAEITFEKGIAKFDGAPYQGKVYSILPNGDTVVTEYDSFGRLIKSTRTGQRNFVKEYDPYLNTVKITENGETRNVDIAALQRNGIAKKEELERVAREIAAKAVSSAQDIQPGSETLRHLAPEEIAKFENIKKFLDKNGIDYDELDLLNKLPQFGENFDNFFVRGTSASCHASAYGYNQLLRAQDAKGTEGGLLQSILDKGLELVPPLEEDATVFRGVRALPFQTSKKSFIESMLAAKKDSIISDKGYSYASYRDAVSKTFAEGGTSDTLGVHMIIKVPKGAKVSRALISEQSEMLFPRNAQFRVLDEAKEVDGIKQMVLEYILPTA